MPMDTTLPFAEDLNYWRTGHSSPDGWIARARQEIEEAGGTVVAEGFGRDSQGHAAYMLGFRFGPDTFKMVWPVLPVRSEAQRQASEIAARIQAATLLYHDVKNSCMKARVLGPRVAFFSHLLLPSGITATEATLPEFVNTLPKMLRAGL